MINKVMINKKNLLKNILATASTLAITLVATDAMAAKTQKRASSKTLQALNANSPTKASPTKATTAASAAAAATVTNGAAAAAAAEAAEAPAHIDLLDTPTRRAAAAKAERILNEQAAEAEQAQQQAQDEAKARRAETAAARIMNIARAAQAPAAEEEVTAQAAAIVAEVAAERLAAEQAEIAQARLAYAERLDAEQAEIAQARLAYAERLDAEEAAARVAAEQAAVVVAQAPAIVNVQNEQQAAPAANNDAPAVAARAPADLQDQIRAGHALRPIAPAGAPADLQDQIRAGHALRPIAPADAPVVNNGFVDEDMAAEAAAIVAEVEAERLAANNGAPVANNGFVDEDMAAEAAAIVAEVEAERLAANNGAPAGLQAQIRAGHALRPIAPAGAPATNNGAPVNPHHLAIFAAINGGAPALRQVAAPVVPTIAQIINTTTDSTPEEQATAWTMIARRANVSLAEAEHLWRNTDNAVLDTEIADAAVARKEQILAKTKRDSDNSKATLNLAFGQTATRLGALVSPVAETASAEGIAAGSGIEKFGVWGQAMGGIANQKACKGAVGFKSNMVGGMIGADTMINDNTILGLSFGNVINNVKSKDGDKTRSLSLVATAYGNYKFDNDFFIRGAAAYSNTAVDNKDKRINGAQVTGVARGKYHINSFGGEVAVGKIFTLTNDVLVTPSIGARFARTGKISYKEKGGAGFDNKVSQKASNSAMGIAGLQVAKAFAVNDFTITPELHANVAYGLGMKTPSGKFTNTIADEKISYRGDKPSRFDSTVGFGITAESGSLEYGVAYDANIAAGYLGHQGAVKLKVKF